MLPDRRPHSQAATARDPAKRPGPTARVEPQLPPALRFTIGRINDNELIFFDESARESWIIYPPRSRYTHVDRPGKHSTVVEHHPWAPMSESKNHVVRVAEGCTAHGLECGSFGAVKAASELGWNPFA